MVERVSQLVASPEEFVMTEELSSAPLFVTNVTSTSGRATLLPSWSMTCAVIVAYEPAGSETSA
jgi:hypothetical protein